MRYMLMMNAPRGTGDYAVNAWSPDDIKTHMGFMHALNKELTESGELVGVEGLAAPGEAKIVRTGKNGVPAVSDGPFLLSPVSFIHTGLPSVPSLSCTRPWARSLLSSSKST